MQRNNSQSISFSRTTELDRHRCYPDIFSMVNEFDSHELYSYVYNELCAKCMENHVSFHRHKSGSYRIARFTEMPIKNLMKFESMRNGTLDQNLFTLKPCLLACSLAPLLLVVSRIDLFHRHVPETVFAMRERAHYGTYTRLVPLNCHKFPIKSN